MYLIDFRLLIVFLCVDDQIEGIVRDSEMACGASALSVAARLVERPLSPEKLASSLPGLDSPVSLLRLKEAAESMGLQTLAIQLPVDQPPPATIPAIVPMRGWGEPDGQCHFVVLYGVVDGKAQLLDYPQRPLWIRVSDLSKIWDGTALYIASTREELAQIGYKKSVTTLWLGRAGWLLAVASGLTLVVSFRRLIKRRRVLATDLATR